MRTLFLKILVWFLATVFVLLIGFAVIIGLSLAHPRAAQMPFGMLLTLQMNVARHAWEAGGRTALAETLGRIEAATGTRGALTDANGRDLVTGQDLSAIVADASGRTMFPAVRAGRLVYVRRDPSGRYWYFLQVPRGRWIAWLFQPQTLWVLALGVLLCYALAAYLTTPVRQLQKAVERFGRGEMDARVGSDRADELGELARTFDRMAERIQKLLLAERHLLLDISHELRSPLARLNVAAELARSEEQRDAALNQIQRESERMNALLEDLLQVTRAENEPSTFRKETVSLNDLLSGLVADCAFEAEARGCSLQLDAPRQASVQGDPELLRRAFENVIRNAIRFAPAQTEVEIRLVVSDGGVRLVVRDYGPGVPEEALPRLFDAFYRVESDRSRSTGGAGLGLAIARRAVDLHHGKLTARNVHPGLELSIELPALAE